MADIKFSCPHCNQHITCDELWGGHQLACPSCQGTLTVPARPAPAAPPPPPPPPQPAASAASLVPKPPAGASPRLAIGQAQSPHAAANPAPQKSIPIRNLAPPKAKKKSPVLKYAGSAVAVAVIGAGCYFGFMWLREVQKKHNAQSQADSGGESQVGHIANLNAVLDATEPGHSIGEVNERRSRRTRQTADSADIQAGAAAANAAAATTADTSAVTPPTYTLDVNAAKIPDGRANGMISGSNFVAETARIDPVGSAQVLRLLQGQLASPDREVLVYLHLKPGEKLGGQSLNISSDMSGAGVPQVTKRWKMTPRSAPTLKAFNTGYAMKLQLGSVTNGAVEGKLYLALPDTEQSVVAGAFKASIIVPDPNQQQQMTPTVARPATPQFNNDAARAAYEQRYGTRR